MNNFRRERGATLLVSLMMLIVLTLLAVSAINSSTVNLRVVDNMQAKQQTIVDSQNAIETVIGDISLFMDDRSQKIFDGTDLQPGDSGAAGVVLDQRNCIGAAVAPGYSLTWSLAPELTQWEVTATHTDAATAASTTIVQGLEIRLPSGNCP